ncbi:MAG: DUF1254 domain-containing protein [Alphaproteobacteria bacterium]|nr:DUF1254 domain-containing protein [Alphaproteobacteria bacterium]MDE2112940.1 DUF1254 domain-containing protein [Alphaproteobacteria bacterium]MDE2495914.1 DUF1254 domain-containing protein [Alphaproteobacteria bacterium]
MNGFFERNWMYVAIAAALALAVHAATLVGLPDAAMARALDMLAADGGYNTLTHAPRADANSRKIVRPSPDLLYSACPFDLDKAHGALRVYARVPRGTYWSVSVFDAHTDNIFVENNRQARGGKVDFVIVGPKSGLIDGGAAHAPPQVYSPTTKGLVLFRTLIDDEANLPGIDAARRQASCGTYSDGGM